MDEVEGTMTCNDCHTSFTFTQDKDGNITPARCPKCGTDTGYAAYSN